MAQARKSSSRNPRCEWSALRSSPTSCGLNYWVSDRRFGGRFSFADPWSFPGHVILLMTMGWDGGHVHEYAIGDKNYREVDPLFRPDVPDDPPLLDEAKVTLAVVLGDRKIVHLYLRLWRQLATSRQSRKNLVA
jgi:hypothetical protein